MFGFSCWIVCLICMCEVVVGGMQFPLGINLGPGYITAAYVHQNGTTAHITHMKGSAAYRVIMAPPDGSGNVNHALVPKILRTTFNGVKSSADMMLGEQVRQAIISMPDHADDELREAVERAARLAGYSSTIAGLEATSLKYTDAVGFAYELNVPGTQKEVSVLVDYNEGSLELWILTGKMGGKAKGHVIFPELGVQAIEDETSDAYFLTVQRRVEASLRKSLVDEDGKIMSLGAVVLAGDASEKGMQGMKSALIEALGALEYEGALALVKDSIDTLYVAAVGAAMRGREMVQHPERFKSRQSATHGEL